MESSGSRKQVPPVRMTLPDGTSVTSAQRDCHQVLSQALNREVTLVATARGHMVGVPSSMPASWTANAEEYWPDIDGLDYRDTVTEFALPPGTFFDCATVHLVTTATLNRLRDCYPHGRFEGQRFRPNIVVDPVGGEQGFAEDAWIGHTLAIGDEVRLHITGPCGRCVMTTLAQGALLNDSEILRTAVQHHQGQVGVYAAVVRGGTMRRGDRVRLGD
jgi:uncharacterized protein YcbX